MQSKITAINHHFIVDSKIFIFLFYWWSVGFTTITKGCAPVHPTSRNYLKNGQVFKRCPQGPPFIRTGPDIGLLTAELQHLLFWLNSNIKKEIISFKQQKTYQHCIYVIVILSVYTSNISIFVNVPHNNVVNQKRVVFFI